MPLAAFRDRQAAMPFILVTVLIDMVSVGLIIPVLPPLVGTFTGSASDQAFWYGAVAFAFGIANFFGAPVLGALSDRYGRRPVLLLGFFGLALNFFATAVAPALWMLIAVRLVGGAMMANAAVANAYVADITAPEDRARRFGLLGAMFGLGFILGPVTGGLLGAIDLHLPFFVAGALALLNALYGLIVLPESLPPQRRQPFEWRRAHPFAALRDLGALEGIGPLVLVLALTGFTQFTLHATWVLYTGVRFGWGPLENGLSLFAVGLMSAIVQGGLLKHLLKRMPAPRLAVVGLVSSTLCYLGWGLAGSGWMMIAVVFANVLGFAAPAAMQGVVSSAVDGHAQGRTMGALAALNSLMAVFAPLAGAAVIGAVSHLPQDDWRVGAPYLGCAALQALATWLAHRHFRRHASPRPGVAAAAR